MLQLFGHPFSSYTWKALIALDEKALPFDFRVLDQDHPETGAEFARRWPVGKFPLLIDGDHQVMESTSIIEYLDLAYPGAARLIPASPSDALEVRMFDRIYDNYVMTPMQAVVGEHIPFITPSPDPARVTRARAALEAAYGWLETRLAGREWTVGDGFTLADISAAPSLFYADWVQEITDQWPNLRAYRTRLNHRPSVAQCIEGARPYRPMFPLGAPDRD